MSKLRGAFTALITPMNKDGSVDYEGFRSLLRYQLDNGITGLLPLGTTGETPTLLEVGEEDKIIDIAVEEVSAYKQKLKRDIPLIIGAGSNNTAEAVRYVQRVKDKGADYALVVTPYYNKPSDEGIFRHYEAVSKIGIPILVYNIAGRTGKNISTPLLKRIAELPNIAGVKEASGDINQMMDVIATIASERDDFSVLSGDDGLTVPLVAMGGDGVISVVSNLAPAQVTEMTMAALNGDMAKARVLHYKMMPFFKAAFVDGNPASIKYAMNYKRLPAGAMRLPLVEVNDNAKKIIETALQQCGL
ncbi:MAG: 4-hydroxy-tetrahydrodipicolinate synthase [Candidatus Treponema excrementipullorum]|nr:4-hydroxy-tetrahydrodipicolinate synthase [Spirochaetia bacterium]MDD7011859.1 4-hydroxy-tetrahydrodipicolinate synthase [Candidatus Treponema excrementipullorum]MDY4708621.1 4-hydroxy-tetrahydrodipicolinate synthase [Candidatus Treponema excrementipullorum]